VVKCLLGIHEALSSSPHTTKKEKKKRDKYCTCKDMEILEHFCTVAGKVTWHSHYGKQCRGPSRKN
jgi:hypothetical protein